jgi:hypothetical protein
MQPTIAVEILKLFGTASIALLSLSFAIYAFSSPKVIDIQMIISELYEKLSKMTKKTLDQLSEEEQGSNSAKMLKESIDFFDKNRSKFQKNIKKIGDLGTVFFYAPLSFGLITFASSILGLASVYEVSYDPSILLLFPSANLALGLYFIADMVKTTHELSSILPEAKRLIQKMPETITLEKDRLTSK